MLHDSCMYWSTKITQFLVYQFKQYIIIENAFYNRDHIKTTKKFYIFYF